MLSTAEFAHHLVEDRCWESASPRLVRYLCHSKRIPRAQLIGGTGGTWAIPRGAMVVGRPRSKKRPGTEPPDPRTHPEEALEYTLALVKSLGIG
jgi:hypothetical protein